MFNAAFMPVIYFLYPETGKSLLPDPSPTRPDAHPVPANRTLEDLDEYYRNNPPLIVTSDEDAICSKRPLKYVEKEQTHVRRVVRASQDLSRDKSAIYGNEHIE